MKLVKPGPEHEVPRGILGGSEISQATAGATNIYMARFRVPAGARSRPHYHANCESALYMLAGRSRLVGENSRARSSLDRSGLANSG